MRLLAFPTPEGEPRVGVRTAAGVAATGYRRMRDVIADGEAGLEVIRRATAEARPVAVERLLAPLPDPGKMLFCGVNYHSHIDENPDAEVPDEPFFFSKVPSAVIGPGEPIVVPAADDRIDYEVELAAVIGMRARNVPSSEALGHVFGYTVVNDVSARGLQFGGNLTLAKNLDGFCPMGPELVLVDEISDPARLRLAAHVDGERRQSAAASDMIFDVAELIAFVSSLLTLEPGDVVSTGTPAGVGTFRTPPAYLRPGQSVTVEVDAIGQLTNPVVAER